MERPTFRKAVDFVRSHAREAAAAGILLPAAVLAACKGGQGQGVETTPTQPDNSPVATETIVSTPTPSPEPSPEPTIETEPTETPPTIEELLDSYRTAYAQLDSTTLSSLPQNATYANIERLLRVCNEENVGEGDYASLVLSGCGQALDNVSTIPGIEDNEAYIGTLTKTEPFFLNKIDSLFERGLFVDGNGNPITDKTIIDDYKVDIINRYFPK